MDIYKSILLSIIEPVTGRTPDRLRQMAAGASYRDVGKMLTRIANFIEMSIALAEEAKAEKEI